MSRNERVAVIGLGMIGLPIAVNLVRKGVDVQVWNRSAKSLERAVDEGATSVVTLAKIDAAVVLMVLPDIDQVYEVLTNGLQEALKPYDLLVVMGTVSPIAIRKLGADLNVLGIRIVDAPVSGGDVGAWDASLSIMVGGAEEDVAQLAPIFSKIGKTIRHLGPIGTGQLAKACNQIVVATTLTALAEAVILARNSGLDDAIVLEIFEGGLANSRALEVKKEKILSGNFTPGGSAVFQLKDLMFALEAGAETGTALPITAQVAKLFASLVEAGDGTLDHSSIIREIERQSRKN